MESATRAFSCTLSEGASVKDDSLRSEPKSLSRIPSVEILAKSPSCLDELPGSLIQEDLPQPASAQPLRSPGMFYPYYSRSLT